MRSLGTLPERRSSRLSFRSPNRRAPRSPFMLAIGAAVVALAAALAEALHHLTRGI